MRSAYEEEILQLIENTIVMSDFELYDFRINRGSHRSVVSILMNRKEGRITLDECADWNRKIGAVLEESNAIEGSFVVEVASPGLDCPLRSLKDFKRIVGKEARIRFKKPDNTNETSVFRVLEVQDDKILVQKRGENTPAQMEMNQILKANLEVVI